MVLQDLRFVLPVLKPASILVNLKLSCLLAELDLELSIAFLGLLQHLHQHLLGDTTLEYGPRGDLVDAVSLLGVGTALL